MTFRIPSPVEEHSLQVRVRAVGEGQSGSVLLGDWSPWETVSAGWLDDACQPDAILGTVQNGRTVVEIGEWTSSSVSAVASIVSSSTGFPAETATRRALTRAAAEIARLALIQPGLHELVVAGVSELADSTSGTTTATSEAEFVGLLLNCVGQGAGLMRPDVVTLGEETLREYQRVSPELSDINIESAIENYRELMEASSRS